MKMLTFNCTYLLLLQKEHEVLLVIYNICAMAEWSSVCTDKAGGNESPGKPEAYVCFSYQGCAGSPWAHVSSLLVHFDLHTHWCQEDPLSCVELRNHHIADYMHPHTHNGEIRTTGMRK